MKNLIFDRAAWENLKKVCEAGYPKEVCGLLFGKDGGKKISRIEALSNVLEEKYAPRLKSLVQAGAVSLSQDRMGRGGAFEFVIDPEEHFKKVNEAGKEGLDQVGVFHSHPDHPAEPSTTDASQPMLSGWSNIIVAVHGGKFKEARSWVRDLEDDPFQEEKIIVE